MCRRVCACFFMEVGRLNLYKPSRLVLIESLLRYHSHSGAVCQIPERGIPTKTLSFTAVCINILPESEILLASVVPGLLFNITSMGPVRIPKDPSLEAAIKIVLVLRYQFFFLNSLSFVSPGYFSVEGSNVLLFNSCRLATIALPEPGRHWRQAGA